MRQTSLLIICLSLFIACSVEKSKNMTLHSPKTVKETRDASEQIALSEDLNYVPKNQAIAELKKAPMHTMAYEHESFKRKDHAGFTQNTETYQSIIENGFINPNQEALSTFSIDVDRASYSNVRRYIDQGQLPPADAVRIEEMINYFDYNYPQPKSKLPFSLSSSLVDCPWNASHQLLHIGLQGKKINTDNLPASNLVFLIDVSGSMQASNKLPLLISSFKMLVNNLRPIDKVAIVSYAGNAAVVLESTPASKKSQIIEALDGLRSGGSTAGAEGINTAYKIAEDNFAEDGNNRVILATDGDFNVGISTEDGLENLIEQKRNKGVFLSVLGFGMGNYKDNKMQTLANKGNGNHAYIDNIQEARKVLVNEFGGTLYTIAKDVKIQIEFNPAYVQSYRLVGYENRLLNKEDFNDDSKDAGELGAGHTVTAMYEIIPVGTNSKFANAVDPLKYQNIQIKKNDYQKNGELATIKLRYKKPNEDRSKKIVEVISDKAKSMDAADASIQFSAAVAQFGMQLRNSKYLINKEMDSIVRLAKKAKAHDPEGYKAEFIRLVESTKAMGLLAEE